MLVGWIKLYPNQQMMWNSVIGQEFSSKMLIEKDCNVAIERVLNGRTGLEKEEKEETSEPLRE